MDDVNNELLSLLTAGFPSSAEVTEAAEVAETAESAVSASRSASQVLSPAVIACRLPCRSLLRPLSPAEPDEPVERPHALPIVSAGSGTVVLDPASALSSPPVAADDDVMPLSTITSAASPSGSTFRPRGAMMRGG